MLKLYSSFQDCSDSSGSIVPYEFYGCFFFVCFFENVIGILIGIELNLYITLGIMDILTILILPINEHKILIYFHLLVSSLISFISVLYFSVYRFFTSMVVFILKYFILFDAIVNWIAFVIFFS